MKYWVNGWFEERYGEMFAESLSERLGERLRGCERLVKSVAGEVG